jgi:hypothetical protein
MVNEACTKVIEESWTCSQGIGDPLEVLTGKLEHCKRALLKWSKSRGRKKPSIWLKKQKEKIVMLQGQPNLESVGEIKYHQIAIDNMLEREDLKWKQRAKVHWL